MFIARYLSAIVEVVGIYLLQDSSMSVRKKQ